MHTIIKIPVGVNKGGHSDILYQVRNSNGRDIFLIKVVMQFADFEFKMPYQEIDLLDLLPRDYENLLNEEHRSMIDPPLIESEMDKVIEDFAEKILS